MEGSQVAQLVEHQTLEVEVQGSKPALGTWWWGRISPIQPYPKGFIACDDHTTQRVDSKFPWMGLI